ncbi:hypothetical protein C1637_08645 [Chryseobacterium lactis]|uniref:ART-PolyVal-like domain-containing protein n=1 Tax=Chryseobacterium lactis TaxID=1241981 RepID=A0A3G6RHV1_CHRLC|nr:hypothetical protein [Chryseobacterium lactis]AZA82397.1 hypothetical protein EG342_11050 [Chryseobacterium lactis]AZB02779.1 hypothetical protein EG341_01910 [Chryseobacterium lactis]PNW13927.1 hypothetical protein C1637_08645 [Chryseobacterium lactis]
MKTPIINQPDTHTLYHGTNADFNQFSLAYLGENTQRDNCFRGIHFTTDIGMAQLFGEKVLECQVVLKKALNLDDVFNSADQAPDIVKIIFEENISDPKEALEFIDESIGLGEYMEFMESFNSEDTLNLFKEHGYDHIIAGFARDKVEYCVFDPTNINIFNKNIIPNFPPSAYLSVLPANSRQIENIIKALNSNDQRDLNVLYKQLQKNINSIPDKIDGYEIDNLKKLHILATKDHTSGCLSYSISKGKLYRELPDTLDGKSPVLKVSADKPKNQVMRISR